MPLPDDCARQQMIRTNLQSIEHSIDAAGLSDLGRRTAQYSGADLHSLCREAAMIPVRELSAAAVRAPAESEGMASSGKRARTEDKAPRPVTVADFASALEAVQASCVQPVESTIEE